MKATPLTPTDLIASATGVLVGGGYRPIRDGFPEWNTDSARLFEDEYGVVGLAVFSTFSDLLRSWTGLQGSLVEAISARVGRSESKAWDGYLVLLTLGTPPSDRSEVEGVRYDTSRLRKIVATGDDLADGMDVERFLRALLPLRPQVSEVSGESVLDLLPDLLAANNIDRETTNVIVRAFLDQKPLMEELHRKRASR
jgi:hypothetical protein